jgi:hypothetical protein
MPRKPRMPQQPHRNVLHVRLDDALRQQLQQAADRRRIPLVRELRNRLLDSFGQDDNRNLSDLTLDMQICWARFSARFLSRDLADQLAEAVMAGEDAGRLKNLARLILETRATEQRQPQWRAS